MFTFHAAPLRCGLRFGSAADGQGIPASLSARVIRARLCPVSRWAKRLEVSYFHFRPTVLLIHVIFLFVV